MKKPHINAWLIELITILLVLKHISTIVVDKTENYLWSIISIHNFVRGLYEYFNPRVLLSIPPTRVKT